MDYGMLVCRVMPSSMIPRNIHIPYRDEWTLKPRFMDTFFKHQMMSRLPMDWPERWSEV